MTCVVNKGASLAVVAVMLGAVKLLTKFCFVVLGDGLSFGELLLSVGKSALKKRLSFIFMSICHRLT